MALQDFIKKFKNPFSLIWKWGFLLMLILFVSSMFWPSYQMTQSWQYDKVDYEHMTNHIDDYIVRHLNHTDIADSERLDDIWLKEMTVDGDSITSLLKHYHMEAQVYNADEQLVYRTDMSESTITNDLDQETNPNLRIERIYHEDEIVGYYVSEHKPTYLDQLKQNYLMKFFQLLLLSFIGSVVLGFLVAYLFLMPIQQMKRLLKRVNSDTIEDLRLNTDNYQGEMTEISESINELMDRMDSYITQQVNFVEDVSHELRTPVAVIEGHMKLLNRWGKSDPDILDESLNASLHEIQRMKILVQEMLDLSRAGQVDIQFHDAVTEVNEVIHSVYQNFQVVYPEFNFFIEDDLKAKYNVQMYRNHLEQVLVILLDNAVKYSTERKEVHIYVSVEAVDYVEIVIQDFGEGMTPEDQKRVFDRFYRVDKARSRERGGNGLGLAIAQELIKGYKGSIYVESALGAGSNFHIRLPLLPKK